MCTVSWTITGPWHPKSLTKNLVDCPSEFQCIFTLCLPAVSVISFSLHWIFYLVHGYVQSTSPLGWQINSPEISPIYWIVLFKSILAATQKSFWRQGAWSLRECVQGSFSCPQDEAVFLKEVVVWSLIASRRENHSLSSKWERLMVRSWAVQVKSGYRDKSLLKDLPRSRTFPGFSFLVWKMESMMITVHT